MGVIETIALTLGVGWASGINLYAAVFMLGFLGSTGHLELPPGLEVTQDPIVLIAAGSMYCVEFFTDKVPGVDTGWDTLHTFIRIPAGAALAAGAVGELGGAAELAAVLVGGGLAAGSHLTKAGTRVMINTSPEPLTNIGASLAEDAMVVGGLWTALHYPPVFIGMLVLFVAIAAWLLPRILRGIRRVLGSVKRFLNGETEPVPQVPGNPEL